MKTPLVRCRLVASPFGNNAREYTFREGKKNNISVMTKEG